MQKRGCAHFYRPAAWLPRSGFRAPHEASGAALTPVPLAQRFALEFSCPITVALTAPVLLAERLTQTKLFAALLGLAGLLFWPVVIQSALSLICAGWDGRIALPPLPSCPESW